MIKIIYLLTFNFKSRLYHRVPADMVSETNSTVSPPELEDFASVPVLRFSHSYSSNNLPGFLGSEHIYTLKP